MNRRTLLLVGCLALLAEPAANAQNKISATLKCNKPEPEYELEVGDRPGHVMALHKRTCAPVQPWEIGGDKGKEYYYVATFEDSSTLSRGNGNGVTTYESGDKTFLAWRGTTPQKDGKPTGDVRGTWSYTGGTGKLKAIKGKGTYKVILNDDGTFTLEFEGEYKLPTPKAATKG